MMRLVPSLRKLFGRRLRDLRTQKGFNQLYLATLADVSEDFLSLVERGINAPSFETIEALAAALETDVTALFTFPRERSDRQRVRMVRPKKKARKAQRTR
jgi:transcriptional regulator with XRE-family HTH domain